MPAGESTRSTSMKSASGVVQRSRRKATCARGAITAGQSVCRWPPRSQAGGRCAPEQLREGSHATLREAVTTGGWPKLGAARGKIIFTMDLSPEANAPYAEGHPSLQGRVAFMTTFPDAPEAAYFTMNEPEKDQALIQERVKQGFLIRTRADADTREARAGTTTRRDERHGQDYVLDLEHVGVSSNYSLRPRRLRATGMEH